LRWPGFTYFRDPLCIFKTAFVTGNQRLKSGICRLFAVDSKKRKNRNILALKKIYTFVILAFQNLSRLTEKRSSEAVFDIDDNFSFASETEFSP